MRLNQPTAGQIIYNGETDLLKADSRQMRQLRRRFQIVFQDPYSSLNPRMTVKRLIGEVLTVQMGMSPEQAGEEIGRLLQEVGLIRYTPSVIPMSSLGGSASVSPLQRQ